MLPRSNKARLARRIKTAIAEFIAIGDTYNAAMLLKDADPTLINQHTREYFAAKLRGPETHP